MFGKKPWFRMKSVKPEYEDQLSIVENTHSVGTNIASYVKNGIVKQWQ